MYKYLEDYLKLEKIQKYRKSKKWQNLPFNNVMACWK